MKKVLGILYVFILVISIFAIAAGSSESIGTAVINEPYDYPYKSGTPEWLELKSIHDKIDVCQIPEDILHRLSDEALVETIKNYPLAVNIYAYDSIDMGYEKVKSQFNAIPELENRINSNDSSILQILEEKAGNAASSGNQARFKEHFIGTIKSCACGQTSEGVNGNEINKP